MPCRQAVRAGEMKVKAVKMVGAAMKQWGRGGREASRVVGAAALR